MSTGDRPTPTLSEDQLRLVSAYEVLTGDAPADAAVEDLSADERATLQDYRLERGHQRVTTATAVDPQVRAKLLALAGDQRLPGASSCQRRRRSVVGCVAEAGAHGRLRVGGGLALRGHSTRAAAQ